MKSLAVLLSFSCLLAACAVARRPPSPIDDADQAGRLRGLFAARANGADREGYRIAPGDKIRVSVARADEMNGEYTVAKDGKVSLPLLGDTEVTGKTEEESASAIAQALRAEYMQSPEVIVAVTTFGGRRVSVSGGVMRPGFYDLTSERETILDLLTRAGGLSRDASPKVYFTPHEPATADGENRPVVRNVDLAANPLAAKRQEKSIEIDLTELFQGGKVAALNLAVRHGDAILVRDGGQVFLDGWVQEPKPYPLLRAMTLTQAISKAGGLHYAASPSGVTLSRQDRSGVIRDYPVDYAAVVVGGEKDIYLEAGDRVYVSGNPLKVGAWGVYSAITSVIRLSIAGGVAAF
ncbi:MAG: polysaccharide biosynthesis/export family protein [Candidatus Binatia bacterium]